MIGEIIFGKGIAITCGFLFSNLSFFKNVSKENYCVLSEKNDLK